MLAKKLEPHRKKGNHMKTNTQMQKFTTVFMIAAGLMLTACDKKSDLEDIKNAQICLNNSPASQAQACVAKLANNNSEQANQLKCAAYFIEEGFNDPTKLINAIEGSEGGNGTVGIISQLAFSGGQTQSTAAFNVCNASGVAIYSQLSSLVQIATIAKNGVASIDTPAEFETAITNMDEATLGSLVQTTYAASCSSSSGSGESLQEFCTELGAAVAGSSAAEIGACLQERLTGTNEAGCTLF